MIWKTTTLLSFALYVLGDGPHAISEQRIKIYPKEKQHDLKHIGSSSSEHHEEYAWSYPSYEYSYKVHDPHTHDMKGQHESRHGDKVNGEYWLIQPDGHKRTVNYHSDKHTGFKATVKYSEYHHEKDDHGDKKTLDEGENNTDGNDESNNGGEVENREEGRGADEGNAEEGGSNGEENRGQDLHKKAWAKAREGHTKDSNRGPEDETNERRREEDTNERRQDDDTNERRQENESNDMRREENSGKESSHGWEDDSNHEHHNENFGKELSWGWKVHIGDKHSGTHHGKKLIHGWEDNRNNRHRDENRGTESNLNQESNSNGMSSGENVEGGDQQRENESEDMAIMGTTGSFGRKLSSRSRNVVRGRESRGRVGRGRDNKDSRNKLPHQTQYAHESYNYPRFYRQTSTKISRH